MNSRETPLERLLIGATTEVGLRPEFYRRLLDSEVLIPVEAMPGQCGVLPAGSTIAMKCFVRNDGVAVIPFYSSPEAVFHAEPAGAQCVAMKVRELFEAKRGMHFHLNPLSMFGREFLPFEVEMLLATGTLGYPISENTSDEEEFTLAPVESPPTKMIEALRVLYARNFEVKSAFLAEWKRCSGPEESTLLVAVELASDEERIAQETATVVRDTLAEPHTVDVLAIQRDGSNVSDYFFNEAKPFYEIGWGARFMPS